DAITAALKAGGNQDVTVQAFPGLNHLFQHCQTCAISEYALLEETFAPEVLEVVGKWILEKGK
ncbi:MAG TPA: alpha/beta hydrolase, partial [Bacteroidia bacterium]|nr:alpha/beta hydrolase [Bacteroidia bacterium]